jgi:hypothetical protein
MQSGKCWDSASMFDAVGCRDDGSSEESYATSGAVKELPRWVRIGESRSSSSRRGSARAVSLCC